MSWESNIPRAAVLTDVTVASDANENELLIITIDGVQFEAAYDDAVKSGLLARLLQGGVIEVKPNE